MGKKIVLTGVTLTDLDAPKLRGVDPLYSAGSLYLIEPGHPDEPWSEGVPATGTTVPNIFGTILAGLQSGETDATFVVTGDIANGTKGLIERSNKGGLHTIVSRSPGIAAGDGAYIAMPAALQAYLSAHPTNTYYVSYWDRLTRVADTTKSVVYYSTADNSANRNIAFAATPTLAFTYPGWRAGGGTDQVLETAHAAQDAVGARMSSVKRAQNSVAGTGGYTAGPEWGAPTGHLNVQLIPDAGPMYPSFCFYRFYIEDLTVSGRTYAEVDAIDHALYTKEVLTEGGRYEGDTFTDPATVP